mmetsp:Transcript_9297/g.14364  ORF Transcript_9297/g.14364 Transcript_9297/m.14364 type:complete len:228 (+) Transcript_9297:623-1306(+)
MLTAITWEVPSPFLTISEARPTHIFSRAWRNSFSSSSGKWFEAKRATVSLVDSSPSTEMLLKDFSTASDNICWRFAFGMATSVRMYDSMVAMFGSIIPAPFPIATILAPFLKVADRTFGYLSVVIIALAALKTDSDCKLAVAFGTISFASSCAGRRHPITPVDEGSTVLPPPGNCSDAATDSQTSSASAIPSPPEQTFETLLLMTTACNGPPPFRRSFPTNTGAPGN